MHWEAKWIWRPQDNGRAYNQAALFKREFTVEAVDEARLCITADTFYRLKINGCWVNDGPARSYPEHYQYDRLDVTNLLHIGVNSMEIVVRYFGSGTFHQIPQRAGLLAQLTIKAAGRPLQTISTDESWAVRSYPELTSRTAQISVQQGPVERYDASVVPPPWEPAEIIAAAGEGWWRNLEERDCKLLSRREFGLRRFVGASRVPDHCRVFCWSPREVYRPGSTSNNNADGYPLALALELNMAAGRTVEFLVENLQVFIDGRPAASPLSLSAGRHFLLAATTCGLSHNKDCALIFPDDSGLQFGNPLGRAGGYPLVVAPQLVQEAPDLPFMWANGELQARLERCQAWLADLAGRVSDAASLQAVGGANLWQLNEADFFLDDGYWAGRSRRPEPVQPADVIAPDNLLYRDGAATEIAATPDGTAIELLYDFGEQNCGYWEFEADAAAGTIIDLYAVEFIAPDGTIQHTGSHRNVLRYICREGRNVFRSFKRRSGRYLFVTVRRAARPVKFRYLGLIESTYPVQSVGSFHCSDQALNRIWEMSARTLKLCMEDTFTDCPLYEQTLWVGDARSEALFAFPAFGAYDLARRCIRLAGRSLERYPIVGCQVPSCWDCLLPAWSLMWGMSVYDYYFETGDAAFCAEIWPLVKRNLDGAFRQLDPATGLFASPDWNMFDWSPTDSNHAIVLYLSMFLAGAVDAALELAAILPDEPFTQAYRPKRAALAAAIDRQWDAGKRQWPDYLEQGQPSPDGAVHTSMLAILYNLTTERNYQAAVDNVIQPRPELYPVCSPFASLYYYMALEKLSRPEMILEAISRDYALMLKLAESTVWETYVSPYHDPFPSRSHCHGWSAAPLYFLPRTVLGLRMTQPGARAFAVSPVVTPGMSCASGRQATIRGPVEVRWERAGDRLTIHASAPAGVTLHYEPNETLAGLQVEYNFG